MGNHAPKQPWDRLKLPGKRGSKKIHWVYWDPPLWLTFWKKGGRGVQAFYILWQLGVYAVALALVKREGISVAHHLTFGKYWIPSRLASLPCPFIFGPVGGGESTPPELAGNESWRGRVAECIKGLASAITTRESFFTNSLPQSGMDLCRHRADCCRDTESRCQSRECVAPIRHPSGRFA